MCVATQQRVGNIRPNSGVCTVWEVGICFIFIPTDQSPQVDHVRILTTCLSKCEEVLEQSAGVFSEVKESSLLQEICEVEEGRNKLRGKEREQS